MQSVPNYKRKSAAALDEDSRLANELSSFYARFDRLNTTCITAPQPSDASLPPPFIVEECEVRRLFEKQNNRKAADPDGVFSSTLKHCAEQLAPVFTTVFNSSVQLSQVPCCFKVSTITPVPKKLKPASLNDYGPVVLTSVVTKVLERLVQKFLRSITRDLLDPLQFANRENRLVDDAVSLALHFILKHLDSPNRYACILFSDFSSAFDTIVPQKLFEKQLHLSLPLSPCHWILHSLEDRPQSVKLNNLQSSTIVLNTGARQGCVLSPFLYSLFTNDCISHHSSVQLIKCADDTAAEGLIENSDESSYRQEDDRFGVLVWKQQS